MIIKKLIYTLRPIKSLIFINQSTIISKLFKRKNQEEEEFRSKQPPPPLQSKQQKQQEQEDDEEYNFFQRRKQIDTEMDFSKLNVNNSEFIPQDLSNASIQEVLYWSQSIRSPEQIRDFTKIFNNLAEKNRKKVEKHRDNNQLLQFKNNVVSTVYLTDSLQYLHQYALFAYIYHIKQPQFWQKIEFKALKYSPKDEEDITKMIDITLIMGQMQQGELIYNYIQKILTSYQLNVEQNIKLFLTFSNMKIGQKPFIDKLLNGITHTIQQANPQLLSTLLPNLKSVKQIPSALITNIEKRALQLIEQLNYDQLLKLSSFLGFQNNNDLLWANIQARLRISLKNKKINSKVLIQLIDRCMLTYKYTMQFIRQFIIKPIQADTTAFLEDMSPQSLSSLSKGFYIYELQNETKHIQNDISKILIVKISNQINEIDDQELLQVIQDYNLTRHGNRQIYIFFEEVIKMKFIKYYNPDLNRNIIQKLIQIYENSGMCTRQMFDALRNLILE